MAKGHLQCLNSVWFLRVDENVKQIRTIEPGKKENDVYAESSKVNAWERYPKVDQGKRLQPHPPPPPKHQMDRPRSYTTKLSSKFRSKK